ncbi:MAG TPA: DoxX family protein, partial [Longimicrobium sp.]|nr:DoxX family protein [Longimicrobium sp.]
AFAFQMLVAVFVVHLAKGFYVGEGGYEFALLMGVASLALALTGPGAYSVDAAIGRRRRAGVDVGTDV